MYMSRTHRKDYDFEWVQRVDGFLDQAFGSSAQGHSLVCCPYSKCDNMKRKDRNTIGRHIVYNGFTPGYHRWIYHGEADRIREEVVRP
jgi:hypothetical protein